MTRRRSATGWPSNSAARCVAQAQLSPWKPKRRMAQRLHPVRRDGIGGRRRREPGVKGGVEAGERRHLRELGCDGIDGGQCGPVVQRGQLAQRLQSGPHVVVDQGCRRELVAAMDHPVPDGIDGPDRRHEGRKGLGEMVIGRAQVAGRLHLVGSIDEPQLYALRAGVDDQNAQERANPVIASARRARSSRGPREDRRRAHACRRSGAPDGLACPGADAPRCRSGPGRGR